MDNENKDFQGVENDNTLTPEEKVREDIRSKIADAAAEVQEEITEEAFEEAAFDDETAEEVMDSWSDETWEEGIEEVKKPEPVKVTVKRSSFIVSLICSAVVGALILLLGLQIPTWVAAIPEGNTVATVNGEAITDLDVNYYIYVQASNYAQQNGISFEEISTYDWDQEVDGVKLSDTIKEKALNAAIDEVMLIQKGAENGIALDDSEKAQIETQVSGMSATYGEDGFALRTRTMAISSPKQYQKMYGKVMTVQKVQEDIDKNSASYYPEDTSVLNDYKATDGASVKHILISTDVTESAEGEAPATPEDKKALAEQVLQRAQNGEDFDALMEEFSEDPGQGPEGYTFGPGEMQPEFEQASFALAIGEISGLVQTDYGYHIIKRVPGVNDLYNYWRESAGKDIKIKNSKLKKISVTDILNDVKAASDEVSAQTAAQQGAAE